MNEGRDDAVPVGGNNSVEQFQPEPQAPRFNAQPSIQPGQSALQPDIPPQQFIPQQPTQEQFEQPQAPQGIFSTADLSVNSENLQSLQPAPADENRSRIASAFARTDATQQQDRLSEQMAEQGAISGTVIPANRTTSSATGDIRLPGAKKKSKAPLLILAMLVVLTVVGGVTAFLMMRSAGGETSQPETALSASEAAFAKYANYLLFGEEKDKLEGEYDSNRTYVINQQLSSETYDQAYWDKTSELLDKTVETLKEADDPSKSQLVSALDSYCQNFNFVKAYKRVGEVNVELLLGTYQTSGMDGVTAALNSFYNSISILGTDIAKNYVSQRIAQYTGTVNIYTIYNELGCVQNGIIDENICASPSTEQQNRLIELSESLARNTRLADVTAENSIRYIASYCWEFDNWLKNPNPSESGEDTNE